MEKLYLGILGSRKHLKCPGSWGREVNWTPQACGLCHARSTSRSLDASSSRMKLGPGLPGSNSGYYPQTGESIYSGVRRDVCASLVSWPDLLLGTCPGEGTAKQLNNNEE